MGGGGVPINATKGDVMGGLKTAANMMDWGMGMMGKMTGGSAMPMPATRSTDPSHAMPWQYDLGDQPPEDGSGYYIGARADGGPVAAGAPYLVGERGPEVVVPQADAAVIPHEDPFTKFLQKYLIGKTLLKGL